MITYLYAYILEERRGEGLVQIPGASGKTKILVEVMKWEGI
jgi:hypothetical protein